MPLFEVSQRIQKRCARRMKIVGEQNRQPHSLKNKCWRCVWLGRLPTNQPGCSSARHARKLACVGSASRRKRVWEWDQEILDRLHFAGNQLNFAVHVATVTD